MSLTQFLISNIHAPMTLAVLRWRKRHGWPIDAGAQATLAGFVVMIGAPVAVTMVLVALWHGATLPFLLFGLLHVAFLLINHAWRVTRGPALPVIASVALTYLCALIGSVLFRSSSVAAAASMLAGMAGLHGAGLMQPDIRMIADVAWLLALYAIVWLVPSSRQWMLRGQLTRLTWHQSPQWAVVMGCGATLGLLAAGGTGEFLYFRF